MAAGPSAFAGDPPDRADADCSPHHRRPWDHGAQDRSRQHILDPDRNFVWLVGLAAKRSDPAIVEFVRPRYSENRTEGPANGWMPRVRGQPAAAAGRS